MSWFFFLSILVNSFSFRWRGREKSLMEEAFLDLFKNKLLVAPTNCPKVCGKFKGTCELEVGFTCFTALWQGSPVVTYKKSEKGLHCLKSPKYLCFCSHCHLIYDASRASCQIPRKPKQREEWTLLKTPSVERRWSVLAVLSNFQKRKSNTIKTNKDYSLL